MPDPLRLRRRLGLQGGGFALLLLVCFAAAVHGGIAAERRSALRAEVRRLAASAAADLPLIAHEFSEVGNARKFRDDREVVDPAAPLSTPLAARLQWFDARGRLIREKGGLPLPPAPSWRRPVDAAGGAEYWQRWPGGISLALPVLTRPRHSGSAPAHLSGFVRVALSDRDVEAELSRLRRGLLLGSICAVMVALVVGRRMLRSAFAPLQRQIEALQRFTADASHELRHPLTVLRTLVATREASPLLQRLDGVAAGMASTLDDLLLLARHEQGVDEGPVARRSWRRFDLQELLDDLVTLYGVRAAERRLALELETTAAEVERLVHGEPDQLRRLVTNVLVNAIQHSPPGTLVRLRLGRQGSQLQLEIQDAGPGIADADRERVFERFRRGPASEGSGLGLAIARAIARRHGGEVWVLDGRAGACVLAIRLPAAMPWPAGSALTTS